METQLSGFSLSWGSKTRKQRAPWTIVPHLDSFNPVIFFIFDWDFLLHWFVEFIYFCRWEGSIPMHTLSAHRSRNDSRFPLQLWLKSPREGLWLVPLGLCVYPWTNHFTWKVGPFWLARANLISNNFNNFKKLAYFLSDSSGLLVFITYIYAC